MKLSEIFKFILLIVVFGLLFLYIKKSADLIIEQKLKEKECINKRVEINGSSYLIVDHDWFKDCYILITVYPLMKN